MLLYMSQTGSLENLFFYIFTSVRLCCDPTNLSLSSSPRSGLLEGPKQGWASKVLFSYFSRSLLNNLCFLFFCWVTQVAFISSFSRKPHLHWSRNWLILLSMHRENSLTAMTKMGWVQGLLIEYAVRHLCHLNLLLADWSSLLVLLPST